MSNSVQSRWILVCLVAISCMMLVSNLPSRNKSYGPYASVLDSKESVTEAVPDGQFALLSVYYSSGAGGYFFSSQRSFLRLVYRDQVIIKESYSIKRWTELDQPVYLGDDNEGLNRALKVVHEEAGKVFVETVAVNDDGYVATDAFPYGYPVAAGMRYFPGSFKSGFLLRAFPFRQIVLPDVPKDSGLRANTLAGIAPDGKSFAYVDSEYAPAVVMVVDAGGKWRAPIPLPKIYLAEHHGDVNPYIRLWDWARTTLAWHRNGAGEWDVQPTAAAFGAAQPGKARKSGQLGKPGKIGNPPEELFISDQSGYRTCFAASNAACLATWRAANAAELAAFPDGQAPLFAYVPLAPTEVFGAQVSMLMYENSCCTRHSAGYSVYLDGTPEAVIAQFAKRLASRKIPFVRVDQCPLRTDERETCASQLKERLHRPQSVGRDLERAIDSMKDDGVMFVMPTMAVMVRARKEGGTEMATVLRADFSRED